MSANVFISYRRDDAADFAGRLAQKLEASEDVGEVFIDVDDIEPGTDFVARIRDELARSRICVVVIGPRWLGPTEAGTYRIHNDSDFVRLEVREALRAKARVLPVLANAAKMPASSDLPVELRPLGDLNAFTVRHESFDRDVEFLINSVFQRHREPRASFSRRHPYVSNALWAAAGSGGGLVGLILVMAFVNAVTGKSLEQLVGGRGPMYGIVLLVLLAAGAMPLLVGSTRRRVS